MLRNFINKLERKNEMLSEDKGEGSLKIEDETYVRSLRGRGREKRWKKIWEIFSENLYHHGKSQCQNNVRFITLLSFCNGHLIHGLATDRWGLLMLFIYAFVNIWQLIWSSWWNDRNFNGTVFDVVLQTLSTPSRQLLS